ncbi:hypothetical protein ACFX13_044458 [Malus domestica]
MSTLRAPKAHLRQGDGLLFSRVEPKHKQKIVRLLKEDGEESAAYVRREVDRKEAMKTEVDQSEPAAMATKARGSSSWSNRDGSQNKSGQTRPSQTSRDRPQGKCPHCCMIGHSKSHCFELIGYPENWDQTHDPRCNKSRAFVAETKNASDSIADKASAMIAAAGSDGKTLSTSTTVMNNTWIIDFGAIEHITCDSRQVPSLKTSTQAIVNVANDNAVPVIGEGTVSLSDTMKLDTVLVDIRMRKTIGYGIRRGKLYYLELTTGSFGSLTQAFSVDDSQGATNKVSNIWMWHRRLGHASFGYLHKLFPSLFVKHDVSQFKCDVCAMAKSHRTSFPPNFNKSNVPFMIVHFDVWGPSKIATLGGAHWFVTFIDDCTRMTWVILLKSKSEVSSAFQKFHKMVDVQYNRNIQVLRSDNGGEYVNLELRSFLDLHGIVHQTMCPYTQRNGVAERKNRHLLEMALTSQTSSPSPPNLSPRVLRCVVFVHLHPPQRNNKLEPRTLRCVFLGYATTQKGYRCYHPPSKKMFITQDPTKKSTTSEAEQQPTWSTICNGTEQQLSRVLPPDAISSPSMNPSSVNSYNQSSPTPDAPPLHCFPERINRGIPKPTYEADPKCKHKYFVNEPNSDSRELRSLKKNATLEITDLPARKKSVGCKWVYTVKYKADGTVHRFKAKLVAKGYTQKYGIDYTDLTEEIYMDLPPGCNDPDTHKQKVCRLRKSLYGLKQYPRAWFGKFTKSMRAFGYRQSNWDNTLFLKRQNGKVTALIVYVDDMVVTSNDLVEQAALKNYLSTEFEMKDLSSLKYFLGIEVSRCKSGIFLSQRKYVLNLLEETGMTACKPVSTPLAEGMKYGIDQNQVPVDKGRYQRLVGRLMYLAHTRPDLAHALSVISQYMHNPGEQHMSAVMRILSYSKRSPGKGILFRKNGHS